MLFRVSINAIMKTLTSIGFPVFLLRQFSNINKPAYIFPTVSFSKHSTKVKQFNTYRTNKIEDFTKVHVLGGTARSRRFFLACNGHNFFNVTLNSLSA